SPPRPRLPRSRGGSSRTCGAREALSGAAPAHATIGDRVSNQFAINPFDLSDEGRVASLPPEPSSVQEPPASQMALDRIIRTRDLSVVFQPIIRVATGEVHAYEALVRCAVPEYDSPTRLFERAVQDRCVGRLGRAIRAV